MLGCKYDVALGGKFAVKICYLAKGCGGDPVWVGGGVGEVVVYGLNLSIGNFGALAKPL
jgi:hypothetical protein